jgi:hypothetical protein
MSAEKLLSQLEGVKRTGRETWLARCPAHGDRRASLSIRELPDGRVLANCFAGCEIQSVLSAVGLGFEDLYPEKAVGQSLAPERRPFPAADILRALSFEIGVVLLVAGDVHRGRIPTDQDMDRLHLAAARISAGLEAGGIA